MGPWKFGTFGKLENVKAEVGQAAERYSLLELESLSDFKVGFRFSQSESGI